jgi:peptidoglycan hydrolase-like protein with peptidoglycan-binding domain
MADTRIGGQTQPTFSPTTIANETTSEVSSPLGDRQASTDIPDPAKTAVAQKMHATESKGQHNLNGQLIRHNLYQALPTASTGVTAHASGTPQPAVRDLQESLNKWRLENGQKPIKEDGIDSQDTRNAVREFQRQNGIKEDGVAGLETRNRLSVQVDIIALKNDPKYAADMRRLEASESFKKMPSDMQAEVMSRIKNYASAGELHNIGNLLNVIDQSGFGSLPLSSKKLMLDTMAARPDDDRLAGFLMNMSHSNFTFLNEHSQNWVLKRIQSYGGDYNKIQSLHNIANETDPPSLNKPINQQNIRKNDPLTRLMNYPPDTDQVENMAKLLGTRGFQELPGEVRNQILDGLPYRFNTAQLTAGHVANIMTLATAQNFEKLHPDKRDEIMNTLSLRPDNAELAKALRDLAEDRRFQIDNRTWRQTLERVDKGIL